MSRTSLVTLVLSGLLAACFQGETPSINEVFQPLPPQEVQVMRVVWEARDLSARSVEVVQEHIVDDLKILIVRHQVQSNAHYGAILLPSGDLSDRPVLLNAAGLNQENPNIDLEGVLQNHQGNDSEANLIKVVPSFRGQTLSFDGMRFSSEGDFCDAYDGAADDAIALLNVAEELVPEANFEEVLVFGASRGGNTALLMGNRDRRVNTIIAMAPPVDFYWQPLVEAYGDQFACQFLEGKTVEQSRERMLLSSPLRFEMAEGVESVFLYHGTRDAIVPLWNSYEMAARLEADGIDVTTFYYPGNTHGSFIRMPEHPTDRASAVGRFLENIGDR